MTAKQEQVLIDRIQEYVDFVWNGRRWGIGFCQVCSAFDRSNFPQCVCPLARCVGYQSTLRRVKIDNTRNPLPRRQQIAKRHIKWLISKCAKAGLDIGLIDCEVDDAT